MKKRILLCLCALLLCLGALALPLTVGAAGSPNFLAVNDTLLPLWEQYIPITVSGQYYVPYTALDSSVTGVSLGIFPIYNSISNTLTIYDRDQVLTFDLSRGTCTDRNGNSVSARAVTRNGRIYVPARAVCESFRLSYSSRVTVYGRLVRIRSGGATLDDDNFTGLAQMQMPDRLRDWRASQAAEQAPTAAPTPTSPPTSPPTLPPAAVTAAPEDPETVDRSHVRVCLAFRADETEGLDEVLETLAREQVGALFFFPAQDLADWDDALRRTLCAGHAVGLLVEGDTPEQAAQQAERGRSLAAQIAHVDVCTVLAPGPEGAAARQELARRGFLCWETDVDARPDERSAARQSYAVRARMERYTQEIRVLSDTSQRGGALTARLVPALTEDRYDLRLPVETQIAG